MRRMDRYKDTDENLVNNSRMDKNQELYHNLSTNTIYTNITDVTNANAFEINNNQSKDAHTTREAYQQMQKYAVEPMPKNKKELEDYNYLSQRKENKTYDINSFLEEARKNRPEKDELDEKRKLKNNAYNILSSKNKEKLEKYREEKKNRIRTPEEEEIHGIAEDLLEKTLAGELDKETTVDLLSDLMATNLLDTVSGITSDMEEVDEIKEITDTLPDGLEVNNEEKVKEDTKSLSTKTLESFNQVIEDTKDNVIEESGEITAGLSKKDTDFYTRSMDLSDKDFDLKADFEEGKLPVVVKILIAVLIIALLVVAGYFIYQKFM